MREIIRLKLGKKLRENRIRLGLTQEELAELANIDYKYLQKIEGKNPPAIKIDTIARLSKALKISPKELLNF